MPDDIPDPAPSITALAAADAIVIAGARYYTDQGLAALLGVTTRTLLRWHDRRTGPPRIKVGSKSLYAEQRLPEWLAQREQQLARQPRRRRGGIDVHPT